MNQIIFKKDKSYTVDAINLRYIYSACIITKTPDVVILHDPWFTEGIYDGSWYQYPKINDPLTSIGDVDYIYISHIHPDHYDCNFLKSYFNKYGVKKVLIANHSTNHLAGKMRTDGIEPTILFEPLIIGKTSIEIIPHQIGSSFDIDSVLFLKYKDKNKIIHKLLNANDVVFTDKFRKSIKKHIGEIDIYLGGYAPAGPYPHTYFAEDDPELINESEKIKYKLLSIYKNDVDFFNAKVNIPIAGKYLLGGKLAHMNSVNGVADPVEVLDFDKRAFVLADNGGEINSATLKPTSVRTKKYNENDLQKFIDKIKLRKMDYERLIVEDEIYQLPLKRLLVLAIKNALKKSECDENYFFCIHLPDNKIAILNSNKNLPNNINFIDFKSHLPTPRSEIFIDPRYLFGLLTKIYHWNNAQIGSQFITRRSPNILNRKAENFLSYLTI